MSTPNFDLLWQRKPINAHVYRPWLLDRGSLTERIQQRCENFRVQVLFQGLAKPNTDEVSLAGIRSRHIGIIREVLLYADDMPVVFAHTALDPANLYVWQFLRSIGNRALGASLFSNPQVSRHSLHFKKLNNKHFLYKQVQKQLDDPPGYLWARRSLFILSYVPLLVTEVFLPEILKLGISTYDNV